MGIKGITKEIGAGERVALSKLSVEIFEAKGRPFRLAIDISIWLFQIQSGKGGTNPALRTFYYRLLRLISHNIHPLFVFDGPNKPPFKRNKRTGPNIASIPEFLAKQLLKEFGLSFHIAPGEAEAECALLQRKGIVDAVLSDDVDTLMFGSGLTLRNWSAEGPGKGKTATHVNMYSADKTKATSGLDREGMILVALMSGGDYVPEGIPGCGPKTACEAARAGFGKDLCMIGQHDETGLTTWKDRLKHELSTNENQAFRNKHKALVVPDDFPRRDILRYYTHPCLSSDERLEILKDSLRWDQGLDFDALRKFTADAFEWICISGAKKFIRNLAPVVLVKQLRLRGQSGASFQSDDTAEIEKLEDKLVKSIHGRRNHFTTDGVPELRVAFIPHELVPIDLAAEDPDPELPLAGLDSDDEVAADWNDIDGTGEPGSPKKKRGPSTYDPTQCERIWVLETYVKVGVPLKAEDWAAGERRKKTKPASAQQKLKRPESAGRGKSSMHSIASGSLENFTVARKPGQTTIRTKETADLTATCTSLHPEPAAGPTVSAFRLPAENDYSAAAGSKAVVRNVESIDLVSSPPGKARQLRPFVRSHSDTSTIHASSSAVSVVETALKPIAERITDSPSPTTARPQRSQLRRAQTLTNTIRADILQSSSQPFPAFKRPTALTASPTTPRRRDPSAVFDTMTISSPQRAVPPSPRPQNNRSTPTKRSKTMPETIDLLSSSPVKSPQTPRHHQRSIISFLSPSPRKKVPPATQKLHLSTATDVSLQPKCQLPLDPFIDSLSSAVGQTDCQQPLSTMSRGNLNLTLVSEPSDHNTLPTKPGQKASRSVPVPRKGANVEPIAPTIAGEDGAMQYKPFKRITHIRLRESLPGTWGTYSDEADGQPATVGSDAEKKRKADDVRSCKGKRWRLSQVETLDLTSP